jgi:hypothetical protein
MSTGPSGSSWVLMKIKWIVLWIIPLLCMNDKIPSQDFKNLVLLAEPKKDYTSLEHIKRLLVLMLVYQHERALTNPPTKKGIEEKNA